jgi:spore coat polysaccharide biosynthesis protein SpsF
MILTLLQARMCSTRLPEKVLKPILGRPMLHYQIERVRRARLINKLVVVTSIDVSDDKIEQFCKEEKISCFRGSMNDVLDRFYQATRVYEPDHIIRLTGDCPLTDPAIIDDLINFHLKGNFDYSSNTAPYRIWNHSRFSKSSFDYSKNTSGYFFPNGLNVEIFRMKCLQDAWNETQLNLDREHVTRFIYHRPERYCLGAYKQSKDLSKHQWAVDEPHEFELIKKIYTALYPANPKFTTDDVLDYLNTCDD